MRTIVLGCNGPVGTELSLKLAAKGYSVTGACRSGTLPGSTSINVVSCDVLNVSALLSVCENATHVFCCVGRDYSDWTTFWPQVATNLLTVCRQTRAKLIFADNLYGYGPVEGPMHEGRPLVPYGKKPAVRARIDEIMLEAHRRGEVEVALVKASDFYGPRVKNAMLGERVFGNILKNKPAQIIFYADYPHAFTYVPDFADALMQVAFADDAYGQAWHVPNAPTRTIRDVVYDICRIAGQPEEISVLPPWMVSGLSLFMPVMKELKEMQFNWDRPYLVSHDKFAQRFGTVATPWIQGITQTLEAYRQELR